MLQCDVLIIGAGPAGSLAAFKLKKAGFSVIIIEKLKFPRFVIGESLLPRCNEILDKNGLIEKMEKQNFMLKPGAIFTNELGIDQFINFEKNLGQKWETSFQVKREKFDNVLLNCAKDVGVTVYHGYEVINYDNQKNTIITKDEKETTYTFKSKFVLDASGYGRVLPKLLKLDTPSDLRYRNAIFARLKGEVRREGKDEGYINAVIHDNNQVWVWIIPFSDGTTSVGIVCENSYFLMSNLSKEDFFDKILNENKYLKKRFQESKRINEIGIIDGYSSSIKKMYGKNYALAGNATEFLDPIFSSGVTLALESGDKVADLIIRELNGKKVNWNEEYEKYMMMGINVFREFVYSWYNGKLQKILYTKNKSELIERSISSILSGYVWDENNYFVNKTGDKINALCSMI